jgi:hypothetical protein
MNSLMNGGASASHNEKRIRERSCGTGLKWRVPVLPNAVVMSEASLPIASKQVYWSLTQVLRISGRCFMRVAHAPRGANRETD